MPNTINPRSKTTPLVVDGVGDFVILTRTMSTYLSWQAEVNRVTGGIEPSKMSPSYQDIVSVYATLKTRIVVAPDDWDLELLDFTDKGDADKLMAVFNAISEADALFREKRRAHSQDPGQDVLENNRVVVQEPLPTDAQ